MALQQDCYTIVLDAALTDIGRQKLAKGDLKISKFALGDDEIDYSLGVVSNSSTPPYSIPEEDFPYILEALGSSNANIKYGVLSFPRQDILYLPEFVLNEKVPGAAKKSGTRYYLSVNTETTTQLKLASALGSFDFILENDETAHNYILIESGISSEACLTPPCAQDIDSGPAQKERYITNMGLMDEYVFAYCDGRLIDKLLSNAPDSYFRNDDADNFYADIVPLYDMIKISLDSGIENFETYKVFTMNNEIFGDYNNKISSIIGPRGMAVGLNFKIKDRLVGDSSSPADDRYSTFGYIDQILFGGSDKYDYIDTNILIVGAATGKQLIVPIRIIRYAGT